MQGDELQQMFFSEAQDYKEQLDNYFTQLEKDLYDSVAIEAVFRIMHTLKANAAAMGFNAIAEIAHLLEDIFSLIQKKPSVLQKNIFSDLFRAGDKLGELIEAVKNKQEIPYKGILTRLKVIHRTLEETTTQVNVQSSLENQILEEIPDNHHKTAPSRKIEDYLVDESLEMNDKLSAKSQVVNFSDTISVSVKKLDNLLNLVEELSIEKDRIQGLNQQLNGFSRNEFVRLQRISSELQYSVMDARLVQINVLFQKFPRIIRDIAASEKKEVDLVIEGEQVEIDRNILQIISDSLIHLIRNAISHGIEKPEERLKANKKRSGTIKLKAYNSKEWVVLEISDDGRGVQIEKIKKLILQKGLIDEASLAIISPQEILSFIFESGFSSSDTVTDISGRGVGMDVVKKSVESVGGKIDTQSKVGEGTIFTLFLPTSMAVKPVLLFQCAGEEYGIPLNYTESVTTFTPRQIFRVGDNLVVPYFDKSLPIIFLSNFFQLADYQHNPKSIFEIIQNLPPDEKLSVIIISDGHRKLGIVVDKLLHQKEIIEKKLRSPLDSLRFISGACILGSGNVCLIMDIPELLHFFFSNIKDRKFNEREGRN